MCKCLLVCYWLLVKSLTVCFLSVQVSETPQESAEEIETYARYKYPTMSKTQGGFKLRVTEGEFTDSQIIVMLGENGTGKTTFIRMLVCVLF